MSIWLCRTSLLLSAPTALATHNALAGCTRTLHPRRQKKQPPPVLKKRHPQTATKLNCKCPKLDLKDHSLYFLFFSTHINNKCTFPPRRSDQIF